MSEQHQRPLIRQPSVASDRQANPHGAQVAQGVLYDQQTGEILGTLEATADVLSVNIPPGAGFLPTDIYAPGLINENRVENGALIRKNKKPQ